MKIIKIKEEDVKEIYEREKCFVYPEVDMMAIVLENLEWETGKRSLYETGVVRYKYLSDTEVEGRRFLRPIEGEYREAYTKQKFVNFEELREHATEAIKRNIAEEGVLTIKNIESTTDYDYKGRCNFIYELIKE
jgi:hypothetical protein